MKSDFLLAITQLSAEKNLPREVVIGAVEAALVSAYRKDNFAANQNISVKIDPTTGKVQVWAEKTVVELPSDRRREISLDEASRVKPDAQIGDTIEVEATPRNAGRIAAQTAKQVILQRLHEAEHSAIFEEYIDKEGDIVTGLVRRIEPKQIFIDLGRTEAILPAVEQVPNEGYRVGQRLKVYLLEVARTNKGPRVVVSRSHPNMLRRLFELEVPEVFNGTVELKSVAREAGYRSKVAVAAHQDGVDPVGCCVGLRGIRIQNIVSELSGEKIDVIMWNPDVSGFITKALSPAQVLSVELDDKEAAATVVVPDKQLSLAIGKEGQNVRLAAKLTGWRIDIKSASEAEAERVAEAKPLTTEMEEAAIAGEELPAEVPTVVESALVSEEAAEEAAEPVPALDTTFTPPPVSFEPQVTTEKAQIRFAEDIAVPPPIKPGAKSRKRKKKSVQAKGSAEDGIRIKKLRRVSETLETDEEGEEY
ncbi:MAG: transcription termination/antitermination protein NusA [Dehalococcoidia bacterium]|nr:MAG: transcription termination/antitermination protein NusA [Dehalococcoidia bacterium]